MISSSFIIISLSLIPLISSVSSTDRPCIDLAACATKHCLNKKTIMKSIENSSAVDVFDKVVSSFDMLCITTKCSNQCSLCKSCQYAIEQMSAFISGTTTGGLCPKLEGCVSKCIEGDDIKKIVKCVNDDCNVYCYNGQCASCKALSKRIFTRFCREADLMDMHVFSDFHGTCPTLFDKLSTQFVTARSH